MVLIETYWNVNTVLTFMEVSAQYVLIETYWNVNIKDLIDDYDLMAY